MKLALIFAALGAAQAQTYTFVDLDIPGAPAGINNSGQVIGNDGLRGGYLRNSDGSVIALQFPGAMDGTTRAHGINNLGQIVGDYQDAQGVHCYLRNADGRFSTFAPIGASGTWTQCPTSINDRGETVTAGFDPIQGSYGYLRSADGATVTRIAAPFAGGTMPQAINNEGTVAGWCIYGGSYTAQYSFFRRADGSYTRYDLPGTTSYTRIMALNNAGQFAGLTINFDGFVGNPDGTVTLLPSYPVNAINDRGQIVGTRLVPGEGRTRAFLGTPAAASTEPAIEAPGVLTALAYGGATSIAPGTWIEIYGRNLAAAPRSWQAGDFRGSAAPTELDGVSVSIGGVAAYVSYVSPAQVNALVPAGVPPGTAQVTVTNNGRKTAPYSVTVTDFAPGILSLPCDLGPYSSYVAALYPDFATYVLPPWYSWVPTRRAKAGDTITLFGIGLGPVAPEVPIGRVADQPANLKPRVEVVFSGSSVTYGTVTYAGLMPGAVGLYQINVIVPNIPTPTDTYDYVSVAVLIDGKNALMNTRRGLYFSFAK